MTDNDHLWQRISTALRELPQEPPLAAADTAAAAQNIAAGIRLRRRRMVLGGAVAACVVAAAAVVSIAVIRTAPPQADDTAASLPADQPACPPALPTPNKGGVLDESAPTPTLATVCEYDPVTLQLQGTVGQVRPVDLPAFLAFVRELDDPAPADCRADPVRAARSVELRLDATTTRSVAIQAGSRCVVITDGVTKRTVPAASLTGTWADALDPLIPAPAPPSVKGSASYTTPAPSTP